jgi:hypothetical protein
VLRNVVVTSPGLTALQCDGSNSSTVAALNPGPLACTGSYSVSQEDLEAGQLTFTAQATSTTLDAASTAVGAVATAPVVLTMAAQPQLVLDVVASSCVILNATGTPPWPRRKHTMGA